MEESKYYMGVPVGKLPDGLLERLQKEESGAKMEFAHILCAYLKSYGTG